MALTTRAVTFVLPAVGMVTAEGWTPETCGMVDCVTGTADELGTTIAGSDIATTGVIGTGLEAAPAVREELELTATAVVDVSPKETLTATEALEAASPSGWIP